MNRDDYILAAAAAVDDEDGDEEDCILAAGIPGSRGTADCCPWYPAGEAVLAAESVIPSIFRSLAPSRLSAKVIFIFTARRHQSPE